MKTYKVVVWGIKEDYEDIYNQLKFEELKKNIEVVALCCRKEDIYSKQIDGYPLKCKEDLLDLSFDYIVIANKASYNAIEIEAQEVINKKTDNIDIISGEIFKLSHFDFRVYVENKVPNHIINENYKNVKKFIPQQKLSFQFDTVSHCNINCKCCDHFCPIAKKEFIDIDLLKKDLHRLFELSNQGELIQQIKISGGEPLLHPMIQEIIIYIRGLFPKADVWLLTNGLKLQSADDTFFSVLHDNNVVVAITKYPINIDYELIDSKLRKNNVKVFYWNKTALKKMNQYRLDIEGKQNPIQMFAHCHRPISCITLKNGRLYPCTLCPNADKFNEFFNKNLVISDKDSISIYDSNNFDEILKFLSKPIPFCKYCNIDGTVLGIDYEKSNKEITEWI